MNTAPHTLQYRLDTALALVIAHPKNTGQAEIHKAGCAHASVNAGSSPFTGSLADDWFDVAPCARLKGAAGKTCTDCGVTFASPKELAAHNIERSIDY